MLKKYIVIYIIGLIVMITLMKKQYDWRYETSFDTITCGEALFRAVGHGEPKNSLEVWMFYDCVFNGHKQWVGFPKK